VNYIQPKLIQKDKISSTHDMSIGNGVHPGSQPTVGCAKCPCSNSSNASF